MKKMILFVAILFLVFIFGCFPPDNTNREENIFLDRPGALDVSVGPELPSSVISGSSFFVRANVRNNGWPKIKRGEMSFYLLGVNPEEYRVGSGEVNTNQDLLCSICAGKDYCPCKKNSFDIRGLGGEGSFGFRITSPDLPYASDQSISIIMRACYPYYTVSQSSVCVGRPQLSGLSGCEYMSSSGVKNTVAPYHIGSLTQYFDEGASDSFDDDKIIIEMNVARVYSGVGSSYLPINADCTDSSIFGSFDFVERLRVSAVIIGNDVYVDKSDEEDIRRIEEVLRQVSSNINLGNTKELIVGENSNSEIIFKDFNKACKNGKARDANGNCVDSSNIIVVDIFPGENGVLSFDYKPEGGVPGGKQVENIVVLLEYGFYTQDSRSVTVLAR